MSTISSFFSNELVLQIIIVMVVAQALKLVTKSIDHKRIYWKGVVEDGGMPSSHSVFVFSLTTGMGLLEGWASSLFITCLVFSIIVVKDAMGVRRHVDILNDDLNLLISKSRVKMQKSDMITGHTPLEAIVGALVGIVLTLAVHAFI